MGEQGQANGPGANYVDRNGILAVGAYLVMLAIILLGLLTWQLVQPIAINPPDEFRLLVIVALAGSLGSLVHSLRSFYWYVGNRQLVWSWVMMYVLLPVVGAPLGVVFYVILRGGFSSPTQAATSISPFGYAALAALVGLFSEQALEKLRQIASSVFAEAPVGKNHAAPQPETDQPAK